jgi:hypothetical protein
MDTHDDDFDPLRGSVNAFRNESARLERLAEGLEDLGQFIRDARTNGWTGAASDSALDVQRSLAAACLRAASSHASAAKALGKFGDTLAVLQPMTASLIEEARTSSSFEVRTAARASVRRFRAQLAEGRRSAAAELEQAAEDLRNLRSVLPDLLAMPTFTVPPPTLPSVAPSLVSASPEHTEPPARPSEPPVAHVAPRPNPIRFGDPTDRRYVVLVNNLFLRAVQEAS